MKNIPWSAIFLLLASIFFSWIAFLSYRSLTILNQLPHSLSIPIDPHAFDYLNPQKLQIEYVIKIGIVGAFIVFLLAIIDFISFCKSRKSKSA